MNNDENQDNVNNKSNNLASNMCWLSSTILHFLNHSLIQQRRLGIGFDSFR